MYCGIDVAKGKSQVCILNKEKHIAAEFEITHDKDGFEKLEKHLTPETIIGFEVTGNYSRILYDHLKGRYNVVYVNNFQMHNFAVFHNPSIKNDRIDAKMIATYLTFEYMKTITPVHMDELRDLCNMYKKSLCQLVRCKLMYKDQISIIFPELEQFAHLSNNWGIANLLQKYPSPKSIAEAPPNDVRNALTEHLAKKGIYTQEYVTKLQALAGNSVGVKNYPLSSFQYTIKGLFYFNQTVNEIKEKMKKCLMQTPYYPILDEFGYNDISLSLIVGEVGDIRRFSNHKKFSNYCGFDIAEHTSGSSIHKNSYMTKMGNSKLRAVFYQQALVNVSYKTEIYPFYQRLRSKGKHAKKCLNAVARKLAVKTYYSMLRCHDNDHPRCITKTTKKPDIKTYYDLMKCFSTKERDVISS
jgi:transposase